jgi:plastocyanin
MRSLPGAWIAPVALAMLALAGCGSSSSGTSSATTTPTTTAASPAPAAGGGHALALAANPEGNLEYNTKSLSASAGQVTITFTNSSPLQHNVNVESSSGGVVGATPRFQGGSKTLTLSLKPGVYKFFCSVPGHRQAGMEGTITVK